MWNLHAALWKDTSCPTQVGKCLTLFVITDWEKIGKIDAVQLIPHFTDMVVLLRGGYST